MSKNISNVFLKQCLAVLKQDDIKNEIKNILSPIIEFILEEISLYLYLFIFFILVSFILHLGILLILLKNNKNIT